MEAQKIYFKDVKKGSKFYPKLGSCLFTKRDADTAYDASGYNIYGFSLYSEVRWAEKLKK